MPSSPAIMWGANDTYPATRRAQDTVNIRSAIRHRIAVDNLNCSANSSPPTFDWPSVNSMERCATTRNACRTAMLATMIAGIATGPPPNATTRSAAASTSHGSASRKRNGPNETCGQIDFEEMIGEIRPLFLRLGREQQRVALGAAGVGGARCLGLGDVLGEDRDHAYAEPVRGDHDLVGLVLGHAEFRLQHRDDKFSRRIVVVDEDDLVQARPFGLGLDLGFRLGDGVDHSG